MNVNTIDWVDATLFEALLSLAPATEHHIQEESLTTSDQNIQYNDPSRT